MHSLKTSTLAKKGETISIKSFLMNLSMVIKIKEFLIYLNRLIFYL